MDYGCLQIRWNLNKDQDDWQFSKQHKQVICATNVIINNYNLRFRLVNACWIRVNKRTYVPSLLWWLLDTSLLLVLTLFHTNLKMSQSIQLVRNPPPRMLGMQETLYSLSIIGVPLSGHTTGEIRTSNAFCFLTQLGHQQMQTMVKEMNLMEKQLLGLRSTKERTWKTF